MKPLKIFLRYVVITFSIVVSLISILSLFDDIPVWYFKILDFPRIQYLIVALLCMIAVLFLNRKWKFPAVLLVLGLLVSIGIQSWLILPYYLGEKTVPDALGKESSGSNFSVLVSNVLITNKNSEGLIEVISTNKPDMVLAVEADSWWIDELQVLKDSYPYFMELPLDNGYGMALYSKLKLENNRIEFLDKDNVPSFHTDVVLKSGKSIQFHGVHPVAPAPSDKYPDNLGKEEKTLGKVGEMVREGKIPTIVAGDFNDVSWSPSSRLFENGDVLKNVQMGRGIFSSFDANSSILRWPLDHYYVTEHFALSRLERLPYVGSDHFPMLAEFVLLN